MVQIQSITNNDYILDPKDFEGRNIKRDQKNWYSFQQDVNSEKLIPGSYAAYINGDLWGESQDVQALIDEGKKYFLNSNLTIFEVPKKLDGLELAIKNAIQIKDTIQN